MDVEKNIIGLLNASAGGMSSDRMAYFENISEIMKSFSNIDVHKKSILTESVVYKENGIDETETTIFKEWCMCVANNILFRGQNHANKDSMSSFLDLVEKDVRWFKSKSKNELEFEDHITEIYYRIRRWDDIKYNMKDIHRFNSMFIENNMLSEKSLSFMLAYAISSNDIETVRKLAPLVDLNKEIPRENKEISARLLSHKESGNSYFFGSLVRHSEMFSELKALGVDWNKTNSVGKTILDVLQSRESGAFESAGERDSVLELIMKETHALMIENPQEVLWSLIKKATKIADIGVYLTSS